MQRESSKRTKRQERAMQFSEDHFLFIDDMRETIREMIEIEFDRRVQQSESDPPPIMPPPKPPPRRRTLWQCIVSLFTGHLL